MRISDWSSYVCSSDLPLYSQTIVSLFENVYAGGGNFPDRHFRMRSQQRLRVEPCEDLLEHIDELNLQRWMQEKLRLVDQTQAVAANGAADVDDHVGEQTLSGTEQQRLVVPEERTTVFAPDHLEQSLAFQVVDLTRRT